MPSNSVTSLGNMNMKFHLLNEITNYVILVMNTVVCITIT